MKYLLRRKYLVMFLILIVFASVLVITSLSQQNQDIRREVAGVSTSSVLTCDYPWSAVPPETHGFSLNGNPVKVNLGYTSDFGGIGTKLELINSGSPHPINIIEARSGAGAAWQYTGMVYTDSGEDLLNNQASGNGAGYQWGYSNDLQINIDGNTTSLTSSNWAKNPADTFDGVPQFPCVDPLTVPTFDEGRPSVVSKTTPVSNGSVIEIESTYSLRSLTNQYWKFYVPVHAFYLNRRTARDANLRMYIIGRSSWIEGPIYPFDPFSIDHANKVTNPSWVYPTWQISSDTKYTLFVWNIFGLDIGILIDSPYFGPDIRLEANPYCQDIYNDACGAIAFFSKENIVEYASFPKDQTRSYSFHYTIGTIPQLQEIGGFNINPTSPPTSPPTSTPVPVLIGDINNDGVVDIEDYVLLSYAFGTNDPNADLNDDDIVDIQDFIIISNNFGKTS